MSPDRGAIWSCMGPARAATERNTVQTPTARTRDLFIFLSTSFLGRLTAHMLLQSSFTSPPKHPARGRAPEVPNTSWETALTESSNLRLWTVRKRLFQRRWLLRRF